MNKFINLLYSIGIALSFILFFLFFCYVSNADDMHIMQLEEAKVAYKNFFSGSYEPLINQDGLPNRELSKELSLDINTTLFKYGYWNNHVLSYTDRDTGEFKNSEAFRVVGYNYQLGVHMLTSTNGTGLDLYYEHYSKHTLDWHSPGRYPIQDSVGINIYLYRNNPPTNGVFNDKE